jgi:predicted 3-demethylubiquinone-9 3-methyltransferase (glyoxalase superfamily)
MKTTEMTICLWYNDQAEEAVNLYKSIFEDFKIGKISRFGKEGFEYHHKPEGSVMTIDFNLNQMNFLALNGGPNFKFNEAISIIVNCESQAEIDHYWGKLTENGGEEGPCGWLKDKFGLSWQINPTVLSKYMTDEDFERRSRVEKLMFQMKKFDIKKLEDTYNGL